MRPVKAAAVLLLFCCAASGHPEHGDCLQHRITLEAGPEHTDLIIEISFDAARSLVERKRIDSDGDGTLSGSERSAYLEGIQRDANARVSLLINEKPARLVALYDPELDLLDSGDLERHPHVLRLSFFASALVTPGDVVVVRDTLWPNNPAVMLAEANEGGTLGLVPRQAVSGSVLTAPSEREVTFEVVHGAVEQKKSAGHVCTAACRHAPRSKGRPGGHRTD
ncbi:MAG: hypothetical protein HUU46_22825 [Candidatus Hydrogenedentes bacterium]|nr:hypothetical protein [Candidatus Hydrogenedentota bacterium]